jgi:hypothetical protein
MAQTDYSYLQPVAFAGMLGDLSFKRVATGVNKQGTAIPFGVAVTKAAGDGNYDLPNIAGDKVYGIVLHSHDYDQRDLTGVQGVPVDVDFNLLEEGVAYVKVEEAVADGDPVYVRFAAGAGGAQLGAFRKSADTATAGLVKGGKFRSSAAIGGIAQVSFSQLVNLTP